MKANSISPALRRVWLLIRGLFFEAESSKFDFRDFGRVCQVCCFFYRTAMVSDILRLPILIKLKNHPPNLFGVSNLPVMIIILNFALHFSACYCCLLL